LCCCRCRSPQSCAAYSDGPSRSTATRNGWPPRRSAAGLPPLTGSSRSPLRYAGGPIQLWETTAGRVDWRVFDHRPGRAVGAYPGRESAYCDCDAMIFWIFVVVCAALTLYWASAILPFSSTTNVERMTPRTVLPYIVFSP